jgi:hypothetical protein
MATAPPTINALPAPPDPNDRGTFNTRAYPWSVAQQTLATEANALAANVYINAQDAAAQAQLAADNAALTAADAVETAADRVQTAADRVATGQDAAAAEASRIAASKLNLGNKAAPPAADNQGDALLAGATYYDTTLTKWRVWTGAAWGDGISAVAGVSSIGGQAGAVSIKTINGASLLGAGDITLNTDAIRTPSNISPSAAATSIGETPTLTGSTYYSLYGIEMTAAQFQVSTAADFATTAVSTGDIAGTAVAYTLTAGVLATNTTYYWRARYKDAEGVYSAWSAATSFTTKADFNDYIAAPTATPAAFGDPLEGGFYAGMIWNELAQTASSTTIGAGSKTFTVSNMSGAPIVYGGQQLEVRSRANPANKMVGVVTSAKGTALTINVTSVGGAGTFTDWSIMSRYRVIVAPKSSGENTSIAYKNANDAAPAACGTLTEGRKATLAMVAAGTSTVYPAAHWCNNLNIAGKTDWYLPARDELELCWRNLKPTADANYTTADRPTAATPNYMNLGSYGDTAATHGLNNNTSPTGATYTSGDPAQVAAGKNFRTGEAEAFAYGSFVYWSASEYSATYAWVQAWNSSIPGFQGNGDKPNAYYVRAVRRSII